MLPSAPKGTNAIPHDLLSWQPLQSSRKQTERRRTVCLFLRGTINLAGKKGVLTSKPSSLASASYSSPHGMLFYLHNRPVHHLVTTDSQHLISNVQVFSEKFRQCATFHNSPYRWKWGKCLQPLKSAKSVSQEITND